MSPNLIRALCAALVLSGWSCRPAMADGEGLVGVQTFAYVLQADRLAKTRASALEALEQCGRDLVVMDVSRHGDDESRWTAEEIGKMRSALPGRLVVAYLSIGEAEDYRSYWKAAWKQSRPGFLLEENPDWKGNYRVNYWDPGWQAIILRELDQIVAQGFDGIYMDIVGGFETFEHDAKSDEWIDHRRNDDTGNTYREDMIAWVKRLAAHGRKKKGGRFLLIPQNGEQLLADRSFRETIDGIGVEDLFINGKKARKETEVDYRCGFLKLLDGKPVLCIEYPKSEAMRKQAWDQAAARGYRLLVTDRGLKTLGESRAPRAR